jgi:hypothetical protein
MRDERGGRKRRLDGRKSPTYYSSTHSLEICSYNLTGDFYRIYTFHVISIHLVLSLYLICYQA